MHSRARPRIQLTGRCCTASGVSRSAAGSAYDPAGLMGSRSALARRRGPRLVLLSHPLHRRLHLQASKPFDIAGQVDLRACLHAACAIGRCVLRPILDDLLARLVLGGHADVHILLAGRAGKDAGGGLARFPDVDGRNGIGHRDCQLRAEEKRDQRKEHACDPRIPCLPTHCGSTPACLITLPQTAVSSAKNRPVSAVEVAPGSSEILRSMSATSRVLRISTASRLIFSARSAGVAGGATRPNQVIDLKPGSPASENVGISGAVAARCRSATAKSFTLPSRWSGTEVARVSKNMSTWPATTSVSAGCAPRYGTWTMVMPACTSSCAAERCAVEPTPCEA